MFNVDFSSIRTVRVHKEQFDAIDNKANVVMITCVEDGRVIAFNRADSEKDKIDRLNENGEKDRKEYIDKTPTFYGGEWVDIQGEISIDSADFILDLLDDYIELVEANEE